MKRTIFGVTLMVIGALLVAGGTALFAVSAISDRNGAPAVVEEENEPDRIYAGDYYKNGDKDAEKISLTENTIVFADGKKSECFLSVWKDMPETDEATGKITYKNYCFIRVGEDKYSYDPRLKQVNIGGEVYSLL